MQDAQATQSQTAQQLHELEDSLAARQAELAAAKDGQGALSKELSEALQERQQRTAAHAQEVARWEARRGFLGKIVWDAREWQRRTAAHAQEVAR